MQLEIEQRAVLVASGEDLPLISLPPSIPRAQALGAERSERLSSTTAEGST
jgi:hypothetical protein